jgi:hypothetical protein
MIRSMLRCSASQTIVAATCVLFLLRPNEAFAADTARLRLGARVRITTRAQDPHAVVVLDSDETMNPASVAHRPSAPSRPASETIVGDLITIGRSVLVVRASGEKLAVQREAIKWMEMRERGVSRRKAALTGAAVGLAVAAAVVIAVPPKGVCFRLDGGHSRFCPHPILTRKEAAVGATALFVPLGAGLGRTLRRRRRRGALRARAASV